MLQQTVSADGILIVDYASTDGFAELKFPQIVTVIHNQLNLRPSGALTTGIEYARAHGYNWIWVLDADTRPRRGTLESLIRLTEAEQHRHRGTAAGIGPRQANVLDDAEIDQSCHRKPR